MRDAEALQTLNELAQLHEIISVHYYVTHYAAIWEHENGDELACGKGKNVITALINLGKTVKKPNCSRCNSLKKPYLRRDWLYLQCECQCQS